MRALLIKIGLHSYIVLHILPVSNDAIAWRAGSETLFI